MSITMNDLSKFKFYAHKVMPLVYDESLSYYEFLCKVIAKLNEVIENENEQNTAIEDFSVQMDEWNEEAIRKYNEFTAQIDVAIEEFERQVTQGQSEFETEMGERADSFEADMQRQWDEFFERYLQTLGVVQETGSSTTDVMSQKAVSDIIMELGINGYTDINIGNLTSGKYIEWLTGLETTTTNANSTDYIDISDYSIITYSRTTTTSSTANAGVAFYDDEYNYVNGIQTLLHHTETGYVECTVPVPHYAKYIRMTFYDNSNYYLKGISKTLTDNTYTIKAGAKYGFYSNTNNKFTYTTTFPTYRGYYVYCAKKGDIVYGADNISLQLTATNENYSSGTNITSEYLIGYIVPTDGYVICTMKNNQNNNNLGDETVLANCLFIKSVNEPNVVSEDVENKMNERIGIKVNAVTNRNNLYNPATVTGYRRIEIADGSVHNATANLYATDYISITPNTDYTLNFNVSNGEHTWGMAFYDDNKDFVSGLPQFKYLNANNNEGMFDFNFTTPTGSRYVRFTINTDIVAVNNVILTKYIPKFEIDKQNVPNSQVITYTGKKMSPLNKAWFTLYMTMTHTPTTPTSNQDGSCYGDYYFQFEDKVNAIHIYNMATKSFVQDIVPNEPITNLHCNNVNFGIEKYAENDDFPLIYASGTGVDGVYVFRITGTEGNWEITLVQTLTWESTDGVYYPAAVIDKENEWLVQYGFTANSFEKANNSIKINVFNLPKLSDGNITISDNTKIYSHIVPFEYYYQGAFASCGTLYNAHGNDGKPCLIRSIDIVTGVVTGILDFSDTTVRTLLDSEPEAIFLYKNNIYLAGRRGFSATNNSVWGNNRIVQLNFE